MSPHCHPERSEGSPSLPPHTSLAISPPIVILNAVKDLLPFPHKLPWPFSRAFAHSWENCTCMVFRHRGDKSYSRCRFIVHTADLSALIRINLRRSQKRKRPRDGSRVGAGEELGGVGALVAARGWGTATSRLSKV